MPWLVEGSGAWRGSCRRVYHTCGGAGRPYNQMAVKIDSEKCDGAGTCAKTQDAALQVGL